VIFIFYHFLALIYIFYLHLSTAGVNKKKGFNQENFQELLTNGHCPVGCPVEIE